MPIQYESAMNYKATDRTENLGEDKSTTNSSEVLENYIQVRRTRLFWFFWREEGVAKRKTSLSWT